jgi:hypothetical protein
MAYFRWNALTPYSAQKMEAAGFSETFVTTYRPTWCHNPRDHNIKYSPPRKPQTSDERNLFPLIFKDVLYRKPTRLQNNRLRNRPAVRYSHATGKFHPSDPTNFVSQDMSISYITETKRCVPLLFPFSEGSPLKDNFYALSHTTSF